MVRGFPEIVDEDITEDIPDEMMSNDDCGDNFVCVDFEDGSIGGIPDGWDSDGTSPEITDSNAKSGSQSLRIQGNDYGSSGYITYPEIPGKHFGRIFYTLDEVNSTNFLHITFVELRGLNSGYPARVVDTNLGGSDLSRMKYILNVDANGNEGGLSTGENYSYYDALDNNWICAEWSMDPDTQRGALWINGDLAYDDVLNHPGPNQIPAGTFPSVGIGLRTYKGAYSSGWIDDIVIGPERIGCE